MDLSYNELKELPENIGNLVNLEILSAGNNKLEKLPENIGDLLQLKKFYLNNNSLRFIPNAIKNIIKSLYIYGSSYQLNNLDSDCEIIIIHDLEDALENLPIGIKELWLNTPQIPSDYIKLPFGCEIYTDKFEHYRDDSYDYCISADSDD